MTPLLLTISATFSRGLAAHLAARLGESETGVACALDGLVPVVLNGLIDKVKSGGADWVFDLSQTAFRTANSTCGTLTGVLGALGNHSALDRGHTLLKTLFGSGSGCLETFISSRARLKLKSANVLAGLVGAVLPVLLGQYAASNHLRPDNVAAALAGVQGAVRARLPHGAQGFPGVPYLSVPEAEGRRVALGSTARHWRRGAEAVVAIGLLASAWAAGGLAGALAVPLAAANSVGAGMAAALAAGLALIPPLVQ